MATVWEEFGIAVAKARSARKWTLEALADVAFGNKERKGYVSQIEKGRTRLNTATIQKLAKALDLPDAVTDPLYRSHLPEENKLDTDAKRLMSMASADASAPPAAEPLMIALAYEFAQGSHIDLATAYTGLRKALEAAAEMRAELARLHNMDARLVAVLQRVQDLNNQGLRDAAGEELDAAIRAKEAELETLHDAALKQDRLRNRPEDAAQRMIARIRASAPTNGLYSSTEDLIREIRERGTKLGDPFDLSVGLELAKANLERAKGWQVGSALNELGLCHLVIGEGHLSGGHLTRAAQTFRKLTKKMSRKRDPGNWASAQANLGVSLKELGRRTDDSNLLQEAVKYLEAALEVHTPDTTPREWANSQNSLGNTLVALGELTADPALLQQGLVALRATLEARAIETMPYEWAATHNNLGVALDGLGKLTGDKSYLEQAVLAYEAALTVYRSDTNPMDWAHTKHNVGIACLNLSGANFQADWLGKSRASFHDALTVHTKSRSEYHWADSYGGLGRVHLAQFKLSGDRSHLDLARAILMEARAVYTLDPDHATLKEFDRLIAEIDTL